MVKLEGKEVIVEDDNRVFVWHCTGIIFKKYEWKQIDLVDLHINAFYPRKIDTNLGRFSIADLPLNQAELAKRLEKSRLDRNRAIEICQSPHTIKGSCLAVDFTEKELVSHKKADRDLPTIVFPFTNIDAIIMAEFPYLSRKHNRLDSTWLRVGFFPMSIEELAEKIGVPVRSHSE